MLQGRNIIFKNILRVRCSSRKIKAFHANFPVWTSRQRCKESEEDSVIAQAKGWCPYSTEKKSPSLNVAIRPKFQT